MDQMSITGIVLAGGQGRRMGGVDKGQVDYMGSPMVETVIARLKPQVGNIIISANRNIDAYESLGFPVIQDSPAQQDNQRQFEGPLAGILACLSKVSTDYAVIVPCDAPLISQNLVAQLTAGLDASTQTLTLFEVEGRLQPLFGLYHTSLVPNLKRYFDDGNRKLVRWCESQSPKVIQFNGPTSAFSNINTPEQLKDLQSES